MASADADSVQLPADPGLLTPPNRVVTIGSFRGIPACKRPGRLLSRDELVKFVKEARAPHPIHNPARPGRITAWNDTSDEEPGKCKAVMDERARKAVACHKRIVQPDGITTKPLLI